MGTHTALSASAVSRGSGFGEDGDSPAPPCQPERSAEPRVPADGEACRDAVVRFGCLPNQAVHHSTPLPRFVDSAGETGRVMCPRIVAPAEATWYIDAVGHGSASATPPACASNGCSPLTAHATSWHEPIPIPPRRHIHCVEVPVLPHSSCSLCAAPGPLPFSLRNTAPGPAALASCGWRR